jgi:creatinine amidohydrolase
MLYGERNWTQIPPLTDRVVVVPLGSMEQHGRHLPLLTDSMICEEIVRRAEGVLGDEALFTPLLWIGASDHHLKFPGTISASNDTYKRLLVDVLESLIGSGFKRVLFLNAHGGNVLPARAALYEVQMRHRDAHDLWLVLGTWFELAAAQIAALDILEQKYVTHSCELETSMILHLRLELVDMQAASGANEPFESAFYSPYSGRGSRVAITRPFEHTTQSGAYGHPELATPEKGGALFSAVIDEVVACVREIATWQPLVPR